MELITVSLELLPELMFFLREVLITSKNRACAVSLALVFKAL